MSAGSTISPRKIAEGLGTITVGKRLIYRRVVDSTNRVARALAAKAAEDGTVVVADWQTAGRGRLGRQWISGPGENLLFSLIMRPNLSPERAGLMTMLCSLGCAEAIEKETGLSVGLKWPNDLLLNGRKLGGVLTEIGTSPIPEPGASGVDFLIVGIGLNVNMDVTRYPQIAQEATSLAVSLGRPLDRASLLRAILRATDARYLAFRDGWSPRQEWEARMVGLGGLVRASTLEGIVEGVAEGLDPIGALLVRRPDGSLIRLLEGDVTLL